MEEKIECSICLKTIEPHPKDTRQAKWKEANYHGWIYGNNPDPVATGRCCDTCDCLIVLPARMGMNGAAAIEFGQIMLRNRINPPDFEKIKENLKKQAE
jgi:hypothetical protein